MTRPLEAVVIGSGFGGAVAACRLARAWPGDVMVLERGKRYPMGAFPRSPHDLGRNFWYLPNEDKPRPRHVKGLKHELHGMFDVRNYRHMDVVIGAGLGGGSLIYANVFLEPPAEVFDERWPQTAKKHTLAPYYAVARTVLGARPVPDPFTAGRREIVRTRRFRDAARKAERESKLVDLMVQFGGEMGHQAINPHGALQASCTYCAECVLGCNIHAKNTLDLNYLHVAEHKHRATVKTEHLAESIVPVDAEGHDDPSATGEHGYRVTYRDLVGQRTAAVLTKRVVVSAGTLGTNEILLRAKHAGHLPRLSERLGHRFSGNGDFLAFALRTDGPIVPTYGPVITQRVDYNLFNGHDPDCAFVVEDASYPALLAWLVEGLKPRFLWGRALWRTLSNLMSRWALGNSYGPFTYALGSLLGQDLTQNSAVMLCMGVDESNGVMTLDAHDELDLSWPYDDSIRLYDGIMRAAHELGRNMGAKAVVPLPTWLGRSPNNITVHPLGGCFIGETPEVAVTRADPERFGEVFGHANLFVADGALCPSAVGANPCATIAALAERVAEGITGRTPTDKLF